MRRCFTQILKSSTTRANLQRNGINRQFHTSATLAKKRFSPDEKDKLRLKHLYRDLESMERHIEMLLKNGRVGEAEQFLQSEIDARSKQKTPNNQLISYLLLQLGKLNEHAKFDLFRAEECYQEALKLNPGSTLLTFSYACLLMTKYEEMSDFKAPGDNTDEFGQRFSEILADAISAMRQCLDLPNIPVDKVNHRLAKLLLYDEDHEASEKEALKLLDECIANQYAPSYILLARHLVEKYGDEASLTKALDIVNKFIELPNEEPDEEYIERGVAYKMKGEILRSLSRLEEAEQLYKFIVEQHNPADLSAHIHLAVVRENLNKIDEAIKGLGLVFHGIKHISDLEEAQNAHVRQLVQFTLARLFDRANQPKKAEYLIRDLLERLESEELYIALANSLARQGKKEEARKLLDKVITEQPDFAEGIAKVYPTIEQIPVVTQH